MNHDLQKIANAYREYKLSKEAGYWSDFAGGAHELFVRPFQQAGSAIKSSVSGLFSDTNKNVSNWWHRNIWDPDKLKFSKLERFLAGDAYYDALNRGALSAHTPVNVKDQFNYNSKAIGRDTYIIDSITGKRTTLAQQRAQNRYNYYNNILRKNLYDLSVKMQEAGYSPSEIADHKIQMERNYWRKIDNARPKFNVD